MTLFTQSELRESIASIWREVLKVESVGVRDNFFELGGNSRLLAEVNSKLKETLGVELRMLDMFKLPTVDDLARHVSQGSSREALSDGRGPSGGLLQARKNRFELQRQRRAQPSDGDDKEP